MLMLARHRAGRAPAAQPFSDREAVSDTDVLNNTLSIEVFPATQTVQGTSIITFKSLVNGLSDFTISLAPALTPGTVLVNGVAVPPPVASGARTRLITLDRPYNADEVVVLTIPYSGTALQDQSGVLWSSQGGEPVASSLSEPFDAGTWWPCKDGDLGLPGDNTDKATWDLTITHDAALTAVSNGTLISTNSLAGGKTATRWVSSYPMSTYLACFSIAKYNTWSFPYSSPAIGSLPAITFPLRFYIYSTFDAPFRRAAWEQVVPMLSAIRPLFGEYPFPAEGYGIYQFPFLGGMEHQTMSGQGNFSEQVTIHELGHQWWGNLVTCRTWSDLWLNEGFATYTEAIWAENKPGSVGAIALQNYMIGTKPAFASVGGTVYCFSPSDEVLLFSRDLTYKKAAWVLHMLRGIVGDQTFYELLAAWRSTYQGSAATTDDFRAICESVSGRSLGWFFDQWVFGGGAPSYAKGLQTFLLNGKYWTRFHVRQTQPLEWPVFLNPLQVRLSTSAGPVDYLVNPIARTSFFVRSSGTAPAADLFFDPDNWILHYGIAGEAPLQGPPVILQASPLPGSSSIFASAPNSITLEFSENIATDSSQFTLQRQSGNPVPFTLTYSAPTQIATLQFESKLSPGTYSLTLAGNPVSVATNQQLDGDVFTPADPASFPTGDGVSGTTPAGSAILRFTVEPGPCPCDLNADANVDDSDFVLFAAAYDTLITMAADFNGDGQTDDDDFVVFASAYDQLLCP